MLFILFSNWAVMPKTPKQKQNFHSFVQFWHWHREKLDFLNNKTKSKKLIRHFWSLKFSDSKWDKIFDFISSYENLDRFKKMPINIWFHVCLLYLSLTEFFDYIKFTFNQTTFLYPVFDADYESEVILLIRMNIKI